MSQKALLHPLATEYLDRLEVAAHRLPGRERRELLEAIEEHLAVAQEVEGRTDAYILNILEDLGDPEELVAAAGPEQRRRRIGAHEVIAVALLLGGAFVLPGFGWLIGVVLLWSSPAWTKGQKWLGTLVVPGGLAAPLLLRMFGPAVSHCEAVGDSPNGPEGPPALPERSLGTPPESPPPPPPESPPPPVFDLPDEGTLVDSGSTTLCSAEPFITTWAGMAISVALVMAALAVAVHLLRTADAATPTV